MSHLNTVVCIMGPTACGKTELAIALRQHLPCDIISVDSAMIYKGLDIGTAKPTHEQRAQAPHRLIDCCDPTEPYSVAQFCKAARHEIDTILGHHRIPLLVGGTLLYFHALQQGLSNLPSSDPQLRQQLQEQAEQEGLAVLYQRLKTLDPDSANRIQPQDKQRVLRALEVHAITGHTLSHLWKHAPQAIPPLDYPICNIILWPRDRHALHQRIAQRLNHLLEQGFIEEVKRLRKRPDITADLPAMRSVGYRQVWDYIDQHYDKNILYEKIRVATCQLAKRQLTWLRRDWPNAHRFEISFDSLDSQGLPKGLLESVLKILNSL